MYLPEKGRIASNRMIGKYVVSMVMFEFIEALIQHIPNRQFKMIRYYGAYACKWKASFVFYFYFVFV